MNGRAIFDAKKQHVSCLAHVINLAVQALLGKGGLGASKPEEIEDQSDDEDDEDDEDNGDCRENDVDDVEVLVPFNIGDELGTDFDDDDEVYSSEGNGTSESAVKKSLIKLRTGVKKIR